MRKLIVDDVVTLVEFVAAKIDVSKKEAKRLIDARNVFVNGSRVWMGKHKLMIGDRVEIVGVGASMPPKTQQPLTILYQSGDAIVVDKPAGVECVNGAQPLERVLRHEWPNARFVHRLDRDTSGCVLATVSEAAWEFFIDQFKSHIVKKWYLALLVGPLRDGRTVVDTPLDGKSAKSIFHRRAISGEVSLCEIELLTGRTHQIRRHAEELGCTLLGDKRYGDQNVNQRLRAVPRQMLHASRISFLPGPELQPVEVKAPPPADFLSWQRRLKLQ